MISKRWQLIISALAIWAGSVFCASPSWSPAPSPTPTRTESPEPGPEITPSASPNLTPAPGPIREKVSALQALNVRKGASYQTPSLGTLLAGDPVSLTGECLPGWAEIRYKGRRAWVNARYISGDLCEGE